MGNEISSDWSATTGSGLAQAVAPSTAIVAATRPSHGAPPVGASQASSTRAAPENDDDHDGQRSSTVTRPRSDDNTAPTTRASSGSPPESALGLAAPEAP